MTESLADMRARLHPADLEAIRASVEKQREQGYPPLTDRQKMIIEAAFKRRPSP